MIKIVIIFIFSLIPCSYLRAQMVFDWVNSYDSNFFPKRLAVDQYGRTLFVSKLGSTGDADPSGNTFTLSKDYAAADALILFDTDGNFINATSIQSNDDVRTKSIDAGPGGEFIIVGYFVDKLYATVNGIADTLIANGGENGFIGRIDSLGNLTYLKAYASTFNEFHAVDVDEFGNYYVSGVFYDSLLFNDAGIKEYAATLDIFTAKYNSNDVYQWVYRTEGGATQFTDYRISDVKVDLNGDILVWGDHYEFNGDSLDFEQGPGVTNVEAFNDYASFLMKLNSNGTFSWVNPYVPHNYSLRHCFSRGMEIDQNNDIILYAQAKGKFAFNEAIPTDTTSFINTGGTGSFILKLNNNGQYQWVDAFEAIAPVFTADNVAVDTANNIYVTGTLDGSMDIDPGAGTFTLSSSSNTDFFIAQYDVNGALIEGNTYGNSGSSFSFDIVGDPLGNIYGTNTNATSFVDTVYIENIETIGTQLRYIYKLRPCGAPPVQQINDSTLKANFLNVNYQWVDCNNGYFGSSTDTNRYFTPVCSGSYALINSSYGCATDTSTCFALQISPITGEDVQTACNSYTWIDGNTYTSSNNTATYTLVGGAANGCDSVVTLNLTINGVSDLTTSINGITITANNSAATCQWLNCDSNYAVINGENNSSYTPSANGNFAVALTENGCVDTSTCVSITSVGILENTFEKAPVIYPNPTMGNLSVDMGENYGSITITITDLNGRLVQSNEYTNVQQINLTLEEPAGVYIMIITSTEKEAVIQLIKQ